MDLAGPKLRTGRLAIADDVREIRLPGFLLHPLVENAITHGFATPGTLLRITVRARQEGRQLIIEVVNSGALGTDRADGSGIGLRNIRERLAHLYGDRSSVIVEEAQGEVVARIGIPLDHLEAWA
jgi:LytS/YehU family sensor histidine kinase